MCCGKFKKEFTKITLSKQTHQTLQLKFSTNITVLSLNLNMDGVGVYLRLEISKEIKQGEE